MEPASRRILMQYQRLYEEHRKEDFNDLNRLRALAEAAGCHELLTWLNNQICSPAHNPRPWGERADWYRSQLLYPVVELPPGQWRRELPSAVPAFPDGIRSVDRDPPDDGDRRAE